MRFLLPRLQTARPQRKFLDENYAEELEFLDAMYNIQTPAHVDGAIDHGGEDDDPLIDLAHSV